MAEILVIDDDPDIRDLLYIALSDAGHAVRLAPDGDAGLRAASGLAPDLVVLDWMLPEHSGLDVCRAMRADQALSQVRVLMLSARGTESDIVYGQQAGADGYIVKPFSPKALVWRVESMLSQEHKVIDATPDF
ncbi:response regulator transcription factor [Kineosporia babensis]|uniref:Response regulator transcription factor n=1 Tax=Kineosporia babensis TaxID=499548 RepID=A0A9X1NJP6_9ACTN|nr:response regulator transcription factor [Kineosporia babensis]MCD5315320.1 response regulator transcription factor [Kineosporia babensis]